MTRKLTAFLLCIFLIIMAFLPVYMLGKTGVDKNGISTRMAHAVDMVKGIERDSQIQAENPGEIFLIQREKGMGISWKNICFLISGWVAVLGFLWIIRHRMLFFCLEPKKLPLLRFLIDLFARQGKDGKKKEIAF